MGTTGLKRTKPTYYINPQPDMKLPVYYDTLHQGQKREVREEYIHRQKGLCHHCKAPLNKEPDAFILEKPLSVELYPTGFFIHPVHLHHSHDTGLTIGAVHAYCNAVLWEYYGE